MVQDNRVSSSSTATAPDGFVFRALDVIARIGNKLPHPFWLFLIIGGVVIVASGIFAGASATSPEDGSDVVVQSLLTPQGLRDIISEAVTNFVTFPPLGLIIAVMLGVAVAEGSGLIGASIRGVVTRVSPRWLTFTLALTGVTGSVASDAIYVVLIPLGAMVFKAVGRSPVLGAIVAFGSASAGYNASLLITGTDAILAGLSTSAAGIVEEGYVVSPVANWYFSAASAVVLALIVTLVTETVLVKMTRDMPEDEDSEASRGGEEASLLAVGDRERVGLRNSAITLLVLASSFTAALAIPSSPLRGEDGGVLSSPLLSGVAVVLAVAFLVVGTVYGVSVGTITAPRQIPAFMSDGMRELAPILVLFFAASQFIAYFRWSNLGPIIAIRGAEVLENASLPFLVLAAVAVLFVCLMNLFITSGSAQWALLAPVLVPMFMLIGISPEVTQMLFRMGDSPTNIISPMSPYFALALGYIQKYRSSAGIGTLMSLTLPLSVAILIGWFLFFVLWYAVGLPLGPGVPIR